MEDRASAEVAAEPPLFRRGEAGFATCLFPACTLAQWLFCRGARASPCSAQGPQQWRLLGDAIASFLVAHGLAMLALRALIANHVNKGADSPLASTLPSPLPSPLASPLPSPSLLCSWPYGHAVVSSPGDVRDPLASSTCPSSTSSVRSLVTDPLASPC